MPEFDLYAITGEKPGKKPTEQVVREAIEAGVKIIQYREKELGAREMAEKAKILAKMCREKKVLLIINDRVDVCLAVNAGGVHLGQEDFPIKEARKLLGKGKIIGLTVHNLEEALQAEKSGADYVGFSPVFETSTKTDAGKAAGVKKLKEVNEALRIPVVAIGGITEENLGEVLRAGVKRIAMVSAIVSQQDVKGTCERIRGKINGFEKQGN